MVAARDMSISACRGFRSPNRIKEAILGSSRRGRPSRIQAIGAVNTVRRSRRKCGLATTPITTASSLRFSEKGELARQKNAVLVGALAAPHARPILRALATTGASRCVCLRETRPGRAQALAEPCRRQLRLRSTRSADMSWDLLINATPIGSDGDTLPHRSERSRVRRSRIRYGLGSRRTPRSSPTGAAHPARRRSPVSRCSPSKRCTKLELWTGKRPEREEMAASARGDKRLASRYSRQVLFS